MRTIINKIIIYDSDNHCQLFFYFLLLEKYEEEAIQHSAQRQEAYQKRLKQFYYQECLFY